VCIANYCRSPVIEICLKKRFGDEYEFFSAGLLPISSPSMDTRSLDFLKQNDIQHPFHNAKKINKKMLNYFDYFLAVDLFVLTELNKNFPKYKHKFKLFTSQFNHLNIIDPYRLKEDEYLKIMNDIKYATENIDLQEF
jgi:protein-tyrosine-phosphatase